MVKAFDFHPAVLGSIPGCGNFFKKTQIFLITRGFQKFWQKTWNQQLLFYYSVRRGSVVQCSDSNVVIKSIFRNNFLYINFLTMISENRNLLDIFVVSPHDTRKLPNRAKVSCISWYETLDLFWQENSNNSYL